MGLLLLGDGACAPKERQTTAVTAVSGKVYQVMVAKRSPDQQHYKVVMLEPDFPSDPYTSALDLLNTLKRNEPSLKLRTFGLEVASRTRDRPLAGFIFMADSNGGWSRADDAAIKEHLRAFF